MDVKDTAPAAQPQKAPQKAPQKRARIEEGEEEQSLSRVILNAMPKEARRRWEFKAGDPVSASKLHRGLGLVFGMMTTGELLKNMRQVGASLNALVLENIAKARYNPLQTIYIGFTEQPTIGLPPRFYNGAFKPPDNAFGVLLLPLQGPSQALQGTRKLRVVSNPGFLLNPSSIPMLLEHIHTRLIDIELRLGDPYLERRPTWEWGYRLTEGALLGEFRNIDGRAAKMLTGAPNLQRLVMDSSLLAAEVIPRLDIHRWATLVHLEIGFRLFLADFFDQVGVDAPALRTLKLTGSDDAFATVFFRWMMAHAKRIDTFWLTNSEFDSRVVVQWLESAKDSLIQLVLPDGIYQREVYKAALNCKLLNVLQIGMPDLPTHDESAAAISDLLRSLPQLKAFHTSSPLVVYQDVLSILLAQHGKHVQYFRHVLHSTRSAALSLGTPPPPFQRSEWIRALQQVSPLGDQVQKQWLEIPGGRDFLLFPYLEYKLEMPRLLSITLAWDEEWTSKDWNRFVQVIPQFPNLQILNCSKHIRDTTQDTKTLGDVLESASHCIHLRKLRASVNWTSTFTAQSLLQLGKSCPHLEQLTLYSGWKEEDPVLQDVTQPMLVQFLDDAAALRRCWIFGLKLNIEEAIAKQTWTTPAWQRSTQLQFLLATPNRLHEFANDDKNLFSFSSAQLDVDLDTVVASLL